MNKADIHIQSAAGATQYHTLHTAPSTWTEMTREHLLLWAASMGTKLSVRKASNALAALLYGIPEKYFICIPESEANRFGHSIRFLFAKNWLMQWIIPSIWVGIFKYHGPKSMLANLTVHEFSLCEQCYEQYQNTNDLEYITTLIGILYRPCRLWGIDDDIRVKLTNHGYVKRARRFRKLPYRYKLAIFLNYEGCRNVLHQKFKEAFTVSSSTPGEPIAKSKVITPWAKVIENAANDIFGPIKDTRSTNLHDFLSRQATRAIEYKKIADQAKTNRK